MSLIDFLTWRVQQPIINAASSNVKEVASQSAKKILNRFNAGEAAKTATEKAAGSAVENAVSSTAEKAVENTVQAAAEETANAAAETTKSATKSRWESAVDYAKKVGESALDSVRGAYEVAGTFTKDVLMDNKPLFYEIDNPHFESWKRLGAKRALPKKFQERYDAWIEGPKTGKFVSPPMPKRIHSFNEPLRKKMYAGIYIVGGLSAAGAIAYHEDPRVPVSDMSDPSIDYSIKNKRSMDYGATGDYVLSSYYNQR